VVHPSLHSLYRNIAVVPTIANRMTEIMSGISFVFVVVVVQSVIRLYVMVVFDFSADFGSGRKN
jgi:hypothetical protein